MFPGNWNTTIVDLGTIEAGASIDDTYFVVKNLMSELIKKKIIPVIIGGSQDITYSMYRAYDNLDQMVNLVSIDNQFDFAKEAGLVSNSFLSKIIVEEPNNLFNYSNLGYQTYFNSQEEIDLIEKLYFEAYRLGEVSNNITLAEPVFRDADLVSIDMNSVQSSCSGNLEEFNPNGFTGKEICALARYAGISDKVTSFGVFNFDKTSKEVVLTTQLLWYFIEGFCFRSNEYPFGTKENYLKYIVPIDEEELVFYKSNKTDRWWIEIPFLTNVKKKSKYFHFELNKIKKTKGEIFLLLKKTDNNGLERGDPRLYAVGYDPLLLEKILEIRKITKKGIPIVVKLTNLNIKVSRNDQIPDELKGFDKYNSLSGDIDIELEEIISPSLPIK